MSNVLIFDLDGCVINSSNVQRIAFYESYNYVVGGDKPPLYCEYMQHTGDSIENVLKKMKLPSSMAPLFKKISCSLVDKIVINWELIDLIKDKISSGFKISICTGKDHSRVEQILNHFGISQFFDLIIGADDVVHPKPNKESIEKTLDFFKIANKDAVFIGDGNNDILCAQNANVSSILATWYGTNKLTVRPTYIASSVCDLLKIIDTVFFYTNRNIVT